MGNILTAQITIEGTRPLLWHAFTPEAIPIGKRERTGTAGNDPAEWRRTVLATPTGQLYLKHTYVFGCLRDGAKFTPLFLSIGSGAIRSRKRGPFAPGDKVE